MERLANIKGIIFDYGGTIDTNGKHWAEVLWESYQKNQIPVNKDQFKAAYIHGERTLALKPIIIPTHNFYDVLLLKVQIQIEYLTDNNYLTPSITVNEYPSRIATDCFSFAQECINKALPTIDYLSKKYKIALVSNFYGNIHAVLKNFGLLCSFENVIESAVVGVRKPNPKIFTLGVNSLEIEAHETVVIGDSFSKDIIPAKSAGCITIWLKGIGWEEETDDSIPDRIITDLKQLTDLL